MKYVFFILALIAFFSFTACTVTNSPNGPGVATQTIVEDIDTLITPVTAPGKLCATGERSPHDVLLGMKSKLVVENHEVDCIATGDEIIETGYVWPWWRNIYWNEYCMPVWLLVLLLAALVYLLYRLFKNRNNEDNNRSSSQKQSPTPDRHRVRNTNVALIDDVEDAPTPTAKPAPQVKPCKDYSKALSQAIQVAKAKGAKLEFKDGDIMLNLDTTEPTPSAKKAPTKKSEKPAEPAPPAE